MLTADLVALPLCFLIAMMLRLGDFDSTTRYGNAAYVFVALITILVFAMSGLYRAVIRFIDQSLLRTTGIGLGLAVVGAYTISFFLNDQRLPRSALMIYWFIAFSYVVVSRLTIRSFLRNNAGGRRQQKNLVAIYGAGEAGAQLAQAMRVGDKYRAICFFDDKLSLRNQNVAGLKVFHSSRLAEIGQQLGINLVVLAIPAATPERRREVMHAVHEAGLEIKTMHSVIELADEKISTRSIREIKIEDLLGRAPVPPRIDLFARCVQERNVLVTGAGGSIGSELCRQIMAQHPLHLHLFDHSEYALYAVRQELQARFPAMSIHSHLGSVCDAQLVERVMREGKIDTVYHAAAYKHVPLVEANMAEGIRNNVIGAQVVVAAAEKFQVSTCVLISTDKAVRPTNIMGASKRIAELIFQAAAKPASKTRFCMVRFGNVLGSSGSVVPLFQKQIEDGGPITITHPDVVRYFMLIPEAAQLVIQAGAMAKGGDVFVLDMGEPIKIVELARTMIDMMGLKEKSDEMPNGDIELRYVGLRPGEKLYEELLIGSEAARSEHPRIMCTTEYSLRPEVLEGLIENLMDACRTNDNDTIKAAMRAIVREYSPQTIAAREMDAESATSPEAAHTPFPVRSSMLH
ncbi:polysaccharide biosynthesis protein [Noviherbaspirillum cavernae]|uniref:Polysaccharide biosynthesis protein n=2 Tax=Noviherbaspirillum cavernae TaxID=2320862 RepID=A0A418X5M4_9BURK|nr:polysaccharide biosynthesis protein [Noviherbaspirillum cavernae]